jgi:citrate lyase subunit beta/citryl-CoA lyase
MGDYSASQGIDPKAVSGDTGYPGDIWHYARYKMIVAARAYGLDPVDGPFGNFRDGTYFRTECRRAQQLGAVGKWAIHPSQVAIAQEVFSPTQSEIDAAQATVSAYRAAQEQGLGAIQVNGEMIDVATVRLVQRTLDLAQQMGLAPSDGL